MVLYFSITARSERSSMLLISSARHGGDYPVRVQGIECYLVRECNRASKQREQSQVYSGDRIGILHFVGGGSPNLKVAS